MPINPLEHFVKLACIWEVRARKAGNVCPGREFADLTVNDFLRSADAIAPILAQSTEQPLGLTICRAIEATRAVVTTNTNLGIVLLLAPLAAVPADESLVVGVSRILAATTRNDAAEVFAAIRIANPGGLGKVSSEDVHGEPTQILREVMALASERDFIAAQYANGFALVLGEMLPTFRDRFRRCGVVEQAIVDLQLATLAHWPDSLIARKLGLEIAEEVRRRACVVVENGGTATPAYREFDAWLRGDGHRRNPGTTADLIAATLFAALREGAIDASAAFEWTAHPFAA
ncbi:MAG: triphosphoribosyl-dephospho-CoA synthetase [Gemmataceae bacterium]|nr:triphosphoribosyl-dephospho-CoA synthetase [Gemmataceae bacterium]